MPQPATQTLSRIFAAAQNEARQRNQDFVGTEHLALALLDDDNSEAVRVVSQMNVQTGYVRNTLSHALPSGKEPPVVTGNLPMSPKAQRMVSNSLVALQAAGKAELSSRFLLASLLEEASGVVCESFSRSGADTAELIRQLRTREVTPEP
jgi:ATP-dependent Clp protease ATP-binding subunit ClpC